MLSAPQRTRLGVGLHLCICTTAFDTRAESHLTGKCIHYCAYPVPASVQPKPKTSSGSPQNALVSTEGLRRSADVIPHEPSQQATLTQHEWIPQLILGSKASTTLARGWGRLWPEYLIVTTGMSAKTELPVGVDLSFSMLQKTRPRAAQTLVRPTCSSGFRRRGS